MNADITLPRNFFLSFNLNMKGLTEQKEGWTPWRRACQKSAGALKTAMKESFSPFSS